MDNSLELTLRDEIVTKTELTNQLAPIKSQLQLLNWRIGFNLALSVLFLGKLVIFH